MIINYHNKFYFGEEYITFDILVDLMTFFQRGILKFKIQKIGNFSKIFINIADAIVKCQINHKNNNLLHYLMYADNFND